jgi:DNA-binding MarR family transcriptional regulator
MQPDIKQKLPIGWYLKEADSLITQYMSTAFESQGINRFHWQVMKNIDTHGKISKSLYYHQVSRFLSEAELEAILVSLIVRNWLQQDDDLYSFTETGKTAFANIASQQQENHEKILNGTTPEEYLSTIAFLETIIKNMGGKI